MTLVPELGEHVQVGAEDSADSGAHRGGAESDVSDRRREELGREDVDDPVARSDGRKSMLSNFFFVVTITGMGEIEKMMILNLKYRKQNFFLQY